jgi:hypothetical protein
MGFVIDTTHQDVDQVAQAIWEIISEVRGAGTSS